MKERIKRAFRPQPLLPVFDFDRGEWLFEDGTRLPLISGGAQTTAADVAEQTPELWETMLFHQAQNSTFWYRFQGPKGSDAPIIRYDDLTTQAGNQINVDLLMSLVGQAQTGDLTSVEGNEEGLDYRQMSVTVEEFAHGVKWTKKGKIVINHDMRTDGLTVLRKWLAAFLDDLVWGEFDGQQHGVAPAGATTIPDTNQFIAGNGVKSGTTPDENDITDAAGSGRISLKDITALRVHARETLKIEPLRLEDGQEIFGLALTPTQIAQLKVNDTAWAQAQRDANLRGSDNPVFTGAAGMWDGVVIYESNRVFTKVNTNGTPTKVAASVFFGAQALSLAYGSYPEWTEQYFDYRRKQGIATDFLVGAKTNVFNLAAAGAPAANQALGHVLFWTANEAIAV